VLDDRAVLADVPGGAPLAEGGPGAARFGEVFAGLARTARFQADARALLGRAEQAFLAASPP
jgi:hypothetical protein